MFCLCGMSFTSPPLLDHDVKGLTLSNEGVIGRPDHKCLRDMNTSIFETFPASMGTVRQVKVTASGLQCDRHGSGIRDAPVDSIAVRQGLAVTLRDIEPKTAACC